jgi:succinoglycan biosynthesis transport protein ExoP
MSDLKVAAHTLRHWAWLVLLGTVLAAAAGYGVSSSMPPIYLARATLLVNQAQGATALATYNDVLTSERLARTYGELLRTEPILEQVIGDMRLPMRFKELAKTVTVDQVRDTQLISLAVEHQDPQLASDIANAIARTFIARVTEEQVGQTAATRAVLAQQVADLEQQVKRATEALEQTRASGEAGLGRLPGLQSELAQYQSTYAQLLRSQHEMALEEAKAASSVRLAVPATPPDRPVRPDVPQRTILAGIVGLVLCIGLAFLLQHLDDAVRSPELVQEITGLHTLGSLALIGGGAARRRGRRGSAESVDARPLVTGANHSVHAEAFRMLRANIEFAQVDRRCRTLMVTSANPGEGKSMVAVNLASVIAQAGRRVLLLDADLRRPTVHHTLGLENQQGLTTLLANGADPLDVAQATSLPGFLMVITSGPIPPNPAEMLGSARMADLLKRLAELVDIVVIDTPPALAVADPAVLAGRVDGVCVVVDGKRTSRDALRRTHQTLERAGANVLGVVLNRLDLHGQGYGYRPYGSAEPVAAAPALTEASPAAPQPAAS